MPLRKEIGTVLRLAWPVVAAQVGMMAFGIVDTKMVGALGSRELAAVGLIDTILFGTLICGIGLVMGIDPVVSQAHGAGRGRDAIRALQQGMLLAAVATVPLTIAWLHADSILVLLGQDAALARLGQRYADAQVWSIAPFLVFTALRQYLQGRTRMLPPLLVIAAANVFNIVLNWALVFGRLGLPAMGIAGAGLATGITRTLMAAALAAMVLRGETRTPWSRDSFRGLGIVSRQGLVIAIQIGLEVWAFSATAMFAGLLGQDSVAAHVIVLRVASLAFMVPLGVSFAAATRVGNLLGAGDGPGAQRAAWVAFGIGLSFMLVSAGTFALLPEVLTRLFTADPAVVVLAAAVFPIAAAWQMFDGTQVIGCGVLRGMGTTLPAAAANLVGYYLFALPIAYALAFERGMGLRGVWWGMCAGLALIAISLVVVIRRRGPAALAAPPAAP